MNYNLKKLLPFSYLAGVFYQVKKASFLKSFAHLLCAFLFINTSIAQNPFQKVYTSQASYYNPIIARQTSDSGYVIQSTLNLSGQPSYLMKTDGNGTIIWLKEYQANGNKIIGSDVKQTSDGGYVIIATTFITGRRNELCLVKLSNTGAVQWMKTYGTTNEDGIINFDATCGSSSRKNTVAQTNDGGYIVGSVTYVSNRYAGYVLKVDNTGTIQWSKTIKKSGTSNDWCLDAMQLKSGEYVVLTNSFDNLNGKGFSIVKLNSSGNTIWSKFYNAGGVSTCNPRGGNIQETADLGFVISATNIFPKYPYILKTDSMGNVQWCYGYSSGKDFESMYVIQSNKDQGYVLAARGMDVTFRTMVLKTDSTGANVLWAKYYGQNDEGWADMVQETFDGGYVATATKRTTNIGAHIIKMDSNGQSGCDEKNIVPVVTPLTFTVTTGGLNSSLIPLTQSPFPTESIPAINITDICSVTPVVSSSDNICNGDSSGTAQITLIGGTPPFTYAWSDGQTTSQATGLPAGTYSVVVTDSIGTQFTSTVTITQPAAITVTVTPQGESCNLNNGSATVSTAGGAGAPYTYSWLPSGQSGAIVSGLSAGDYTVTVSDSTTCMVSATVSIASSGSLILEPVSAPACGENNGTALVNSSGANAPYSYSWSPAGGVDSIATGLGAGTYTCIVTDATGCMEDTSVQVFAYPLPLADAGSDITITGVDSISLNASGGVTYVWSPAEGLSCISCNGPFAKPDKTTSYCVLVTDSNGCTDSDCVTVDLQCGDLFIPNAFSPNDDGHNDKGCIYGPCIESVLFTIYDRWGTKVFETTDPSQCWDGIFKENLMKPGVFVYRAKITLTNGDLQMKQGNISIVY